MRKTYHTVMRRLKERLWWLWHSEMRSLYGLHGYYDGRPWYHLCCNGNAGGWRTRICDSLEGYDTGYRYHERVLEKEQNNE